MTRLAVLLVLFLSGPAFADPPYQYPGPTDSAQILAANSNCSKLIFQNSNDSVKVAICPSGPSRSNAAIKGSGCVTTLPYGSDRPAISQPRKPFPVMGRCWSAGIHAARGQFQCRHLGLGDAMPEPDDQRLGLITAASTTTCTPPMGNATGTLAVANGGTGNRTLTANSVLVGNGTSAVSQVTPSAVGQVFVSPAGRPPSWSQTLALGNARLIALFFLFPALF
jgi:hypothetical protein